MLSPYLRSEFAKLLERSKPENFVGLEARWVDAKKATIRREWKNLEYVANRQVTREEI